jgi:hypothetical protein
LGRGGLLCGNSEPRFELDSVQSTGVVILAPNFMNHLVISFIHDLYQKSHSRKFAPLTPSGISVNLGRGVLASAFK